MTHIDRTPVIRQTIESSLDAAGLSSAGFTAKPQAGLRSWFDVTGLAAASIGAACAEISALANPDASQEDTQVDPRLASLWFGMSIKPVGWELPPIWDAIAGLYQTSDGWIRLHTNAPHHKQAALEVLACDADRTAVATAVRVWRAQTLENAIVERGGCAAEQRSIQAWNSHPQGKAVNAEPLVGWSERGRVESFAVGPAAPLRGLRVLDLTRVLAGPVATRFLAAFGADVLRIDPPGWSEANIVPDVSLGKRCATLDLANEEDRHRFLSLLRDADLLVHGYRPDALERLGLGSVARARINPGLIDIALCAYGWTGPWRHRRGYDSLVQMSAGIAHLGMVRSDDQRPTPLPVQALDHATGYLMAAAAVRALRIRNDRGRALAARLSLARTAALLIETLQDGWPVPLAAATASDFSESTEITDWGPAQRLRFPARLAQVEPDWKIPAHELHSHSANWESS